MTAGPAFGTDADCNALAEVVGWTLASNVEVHFTANQQPAQPGGAVHIGEESKIAGG